MRFVTIKIKSKYWILDTLTEEQCVGFRLKRDANSIRSQWNEQEYAEQEKRFSRALELRSSFKLIKSA